MKNRKLLNLLTYGLTGFIISARTSAFSAIVDEFSLNYSSISLLVLISGLTMQISTFAAGFSIRKYGHSKNIFTGLLLFVLSFVLIYFSASYLMVFISFCIMMLGFGIIVIAINMYTGFLAGIEGDTPGPSIMKLHLGFSVGALLGPKSISYFITSGMNWRFIYVLTAAAVLVISIFYLFLKDLNFSNAKHENSRKIENSITPKKDFGLKAEYVPDRKYLKTAAVLFVIIFIAGQIWEYGFGTWFVIFAKKYFSLNESAASAYLTLFWVCFPVSRISAGWFVRKAGTVALLTVSFIMIFLLAASGFIFSNPLFFSLSGFFTALLYPLTMALMQEMLGRDRSDLIGLISMTGGLVIYLLIALAGSIADSSGIAAGFGSTAVYLLAGASAAAAVSRLMKKIE